MKLIKKEQDHFVLVSERQIIASTDSGDDVTQLSLREIKKLVGESSLKEDFLAVLERSGKDANPFEKQGIQKGFILGWGLCEDENKDKKYTEEDLRNAIKLARVYGKTLDNDYVSNEIIKYLQPKTEWDVEFVDGELRLI